MIWAVLAVPLTYTRYTEIPNWLWLSHRKCLSIGHPHPHLHPRPNDKRVASSLSPCAAQMEVQLFDGGRVVQTKPAIGSAQKVRHTFIPPAMLPVVRAFMALPGAATFTLDQLHAPDAFLKVCAVRQLMALHALVFLGEEESKRWRRRRDFDIREPDR